MQDGVPFFKRAALSPDSCYCWSWRPHQTYAPRWTLKAFSPVNVLQHFPFGAGCEQEHLQKEHTTMNFF